MKTTLLNFISAISLMSISGTAFAGMVMGPISVSVPVDAPWAIAGIGAVVAVIAARVIANRRK